MNSQASLFDLPAPPEPKANPIRKERDRLNAAALRVLERLKQGPASNIQICTPECGGLRGIGRVHEIRQQGWIVEKRHVSGGLWIYTLKGLKGQV